MDEPKRPQSRRLKLEFPADLAATYANFAMITHSRWEMFLDFAQILPNAPKARVQTRIVLTPTNAKMLLKALEENVARYETQYGEIALPPRPQTLADQLFNTVRSDDTGDSGADDADDPAESDDGSDT